MLFEFSALANSIMPLDSFIAEYSASLLSFSGFCNKDSPFKYKQSKQNTHTLIFISSKLTSFLALVLNN